ncbi:MULTISPECIES: ABC transporter permease [unclassified Streptomyces]|uniref:ABC transporter permease n=1 Tax=unclassified Streptomyces TaxID=2593676 RepID=UPI00039D0A55|nr:MULTISPECIES: ABC transporter permease [unclassified Streptomyces]
MTTTTTAAKGRAGRGVAPVRAHLVVERNLMIHRHTWAVFAAEMLEPLLYLMSIGVGVGHLIGRVPGVTDPHLGYASFVAPALLATCAMNAAMNETTFGMFFKLKDDRIYESMVTTPLSVADIAFGEIGWALLRGVAAATGFLAIVSVLGYVESPWILLALPGAVLIGFCFAAIGLAATTWLRTMQDFQLIQLVMLPMFLFATTFYPVTVYPEPVQVVVKCLPLYHGIELLRGPALGDLHPGLLLSAGYLLALGAAALFVALPRLERRLMS